MASFIDPKAVSEVKRTRGDDARHKVSDDDFAKQLKDKSFISKDILDIVNINKNTNLKNINESTKKSIDGKTVKNLLGD